MSPDAPSTPRSLWIRAFGVLLHWTPVALALGLFAQLALLGLKPALAERERLRAAGERLEERLEADEEQHDRLSAFHTALDDPIYRERLRLERQQASAVGSE